MVAGELSTEGDVVSIPPPRLLEQVRDLMRVKHMSIRTENAYCSWIRRFIFFHHKRPRGEMGRKATIRLGSRYSCYVQIGFD